MNVLTVQQAASTFSVLLPGDDPRTSCYNIYQEQGDNKYFKKTFVFDGTDLVILGVLLMTVDV
jgi:hypothetical protein